VQIVDYLKEARDKLIPYFMEKQPEPTTDRCCVYLSTNEISLLHINKTPSGIDILLTETLAFDDAETLHLVLSGLVQRYALQSTPTYLLLSPDEYQLFLIESLPVKQGEILDALSFRLRSLISYPVEEAVVDYFLLPAKKSDKNNSMVAAVTANINSLTRLINIFKNSGFLLTTIDIPELAMRNLTATYENDEKATAFIYFFKHIAILNITCQKTLYFTRHIIFSNIDEEFSLELLRYFDYFQSQWRYPPPSRIFVATDNHHSQDITQALSKFLSTNVELITTKSKSVLTYGCALREETTHVTPRY
jgi:MSHA biogenesis protein MshI